MRYHCLACDYDGTLALDERVPATTVASLQEVRASGRRLLLVTGRELEDLRMIFPRLDLFDLVVAENGALLYRPHDHRIRLLAGKPSLRFVDELRRRGVGPISVGHAIVATWQPYEQTVREVIRDLGLKLQVIFNKGAVMVLPAGVNKATGLRVALLELQMTAQNAVGVGDAENDHAFLDGCGCSVAVANAIPTLRQKVDLVTNADHGAGVEELISRLLRNDLSDIDCVRKRQSSNREGRVMTPTARGSGGN
jgi:hydroxymethylpyrimidine pyrophosphatase-like HAD family hydrolase